MARNVRAMRGNPTMPEGIEVAWYKTYEAAKNGVDKLADNDFPLEAVTIVGSDLHTVEKVLGRLTPPRVALGGATQGLTWGLFMGLMAFLIIPDAPPLVPLIAVAFGALAGVTLTTIVWALSKNRRRFASQSHLVASRYAVLVTISQDRAFELLQGTKGNQVHARKVSPRLQRAEEKLGGPPSEYGSRADEKPRFGVRIDDAQNAAADEPKPAEGNADMTENNGSGTGVPSGGDQN